MHRSEVVEYTPLSYRFAASLVDELVVALLALAIGFVIFYFALDLTGDLNLDLQKDGSPSQMSALDLGVFEGEPEALALTWARLVWLPILVAYHLAFWRFGRTAGLWLLSSRVVSARTGEPATLGRLLARLVVSRISLQLLGLGFWLALRDGQRRTWYDRVAGTVVIADGSMRDLDEDERRDVRIMTGPAPWLGAGQADRA